jgi:hypothetical protein
MKTYRARNTTAEHGNGHQLSAAGSFSGLGSWRGGCVVNNRLVRFLLDSKPDRQHRPECCREDAAQAHGRC